MVAEEASRSPGRRPRRRAVGHADAAGGEVGGGDPLRRPGPFSNTNTSGPESRAASAATTRLSTTAASGAPRRSPPARRTRPRG